jgi:hypothetical protein
MQLQAAMGLIAVKVQRHSEEHDLHHREGEYGIAPKRELDQAVGEMQWHRWNTSGGWLSQSSPADIRCAARKARSVR